MSSWTASCFACEGDLQGTAAILVFQNIRYGCLTQDLQKCCFSWGDTSYKSLVDASRWLWRTMDWVSLDASGQSRWWQAGISLLSPQRWKSWYSGTHTCSLNSTGGFPVRVSEHRSIASSFLNVHVESSLAPGVASLASIILLFKGWGKWCFTSILFFRCRLTSFCVI